MLTIRYRFPWQRAALLTAGATFFLGGCDPQLRATIENGIISASTSFFASLLQALIELAAEANDQSARVVSELAPIVA